MQQRPADKTPPVLAILPLEGDSEEFTIRPGETIQLRVQVKNFGTSQANTVTGVLSSEDPYLAIIDGSDSYGTIAAGGGYELDAIASCILGGTSTLGGVGTISGAMIGALIMSSLTTGLQMMNVAPAWQYVLKGIVLVLAVFADVYFKKSR